VQWINQTLGRVAPAFECPSWDGSDACCNPELAGKGDDVQYVLSVVEAITAKYNVDMSRIYLMGIATGGFMVNRIACEAGLLRVAQVEFS
jgi:poly(3-hydroxybutyrate) depolymerase